MMNPMKSIKTWLQRQNEQAYLAGLSGPACADVGLSREDLLKFSKCGSEVRNRLLTMALAHGVRPAQIDADRWRQVDIARTCAQCTEQRKCKRWLQSMDQDPSETGFCPNIPHFEALSGTSRLELAEQS